MSLSAPSTAARPRAAVAWLRAFALWMLLFAGLLAGGAAHADSVEAALSPGLMSKAHAKYEGDCAQCHVRFDRNAQDRLCADCHKEVRQDVRDHTGFHGRQKPQACRSCHTEHKGLDAKLAPVDTKTFDHKETDYPLLGKHQKTDCAKCHVAGKRWAAAAHDCVACHKKDDTHKGSLGPKCGDGHTEASWKEAKFDHDKTRFPLTGKHVDTKCDECHAHGRYKDTPMTCYGCHKADDGKAHKGRYGEKCETCHDAQSWKSAPLFHHDTDTKYPLKGKHVKVKCDACHTGMLYKDKLSQDCIACHKKDDVHKESLGTNCASCHVESSWKEVGKFDHDKTRFKLKDKHAAAKCVDCHVNAAKNDFKNAPNTCFGCHKKDDKHKANLGEDCGSCHGAKDWKVPGFDHDRSKFKLRNAHAAAKVKCSDCHKDPTKYRDIPSTCVSCHLKDDKHEGQLGKDCGACHDDRNWKVKQFNHARTRFPLTGAHIAAECKACHTTPKYHDAPRACYGCHKKEDVHKERLGAGCELCHNTRGWKVAAFDHEKTRFHLGLAHEKLICEACHKEKTPAGKKIAPLAVECVSCHRKDDVHEGQFGARCEACHASTKWKDVRAVRPAAPASGGGATPAAASGPS